MKFQRNHSQRVFPVMPPGRSELKCLHFLTVLNILGNHVCVIINDIIIHSVILLNHLQDPHSLKPKSKQRTVVDKVEPFTSSTDLIYSHIHVLGSLLVRRSLLPSSGAV